MRRYLLLLVLCLAASRAAALTVALTDFTSDDNSYRSAVAAADFAAAVQTALANTPNVEWVERQQLRQAMAELKLGAFGWTSPATAVRLGKWVKADWLILGEFVTDADRKRTLHLELVDLDRADRLAEQVLPWPRGPLAFSPTEVQAAAAGLRRQLTEAGQRRRESRNQVAVAPLFFRNVGREARLDFLEDDLQQALTTAARPQPGVRLVRFPRARPATAEAELVALGLAEIDHDAWQRVADLYVWGTFVEQGAPDQPFDTVPVQVTIHIWDGHGAPRAITNQATVAGLPALCAQVAGTILDAARQRPVTLPQPDARQVVAGWLQGQARAVRLKYTNRNGRVDFQSTIEGRKAWRYVVDLLETACFFAPDDVHIQRERLVNRWRWEMVLDDPHQFWVELGRARDWGRFVEQFGPRALDEPSDGQREYVEQSRLKVLIGQSDAKQAYIESAHWTMVRFGMIPCGFPADLPAAERDRWRAELETDYANRAVVAGDPQFLVPCFSLVKNPQSRVKMCEALWPFVVNPKPYHARVNMKREWWEQNIRRTYQEAGIPDQANRLLSSAPAAPVPISGIPREKRFEVPRLDLLPPALVTSPKLLPFYGEFRTTTALAYHDGQLWISGQGPATGTVSSGSLLDFLAYQHTTTAVWRYTPASGQLTNVSERVGMKSRALAFLPDHDHLWIATQQEGVWRINTTTLAGRASSTRDGLLSPEVYALAQSAGQLVAGGGPAHAAKLSRQDADQSTWRALPISGWQPGLSGVPAPQRVTHLAAFQDWLVSYAGEGQPLLLNRAKGAWSNLSDSLCRTAQHVSFPRQRIELLASAVDDAGFWLGTGIGLIRFDPRTGQTEESLSPTGEFLYDQVGHFPLHRAEGRVRPSLLPTSRLLGGVTALADDGEFLWVATSVVGEFAASPVDGPYVLLWHKPSRHWVGQFKVKARVTSLAVSAEKLWIGLATGYDTILEVDKAPLLRTPRDRWVTDEITAAELANRLSTLSPRLQARYAFLLGDYARAVQLLDKEPHDIDALFMLAYSHDSRGLNQPAKARACFEELIQHFPDSLWVKEARQQLGRLPAAPTAAAGP